MKRARNGSKNGAPKAVRPRATPRQQAARKKYLELTGTKVYSGADCGHSGSMGGLTLDTGALIALERTRKRIREIVAAAQAGKDRITVPAAAIVEWWRGPEKGRQLIRTMFDIEPLDEDLAKRAGEYIPELDDQSSSTSAESEGMLWTWPPCSR
jgi:hypothetical protein